MSTYANGFARGGGAPSTAEGHIVAFGGTEEDLIAKNLGLEQLGTRGEPARDRSTGSGFVAKRDGAYADALTKGSDVHLCVTENSGAINGVLSSILRGLSAAARVPGAVDSTAYGAGRQSAVDHLALRPPRRRDIDGSADGGRGHGSQRRLALSLPALARHRRVDAPPGAPTGMCVA